MNEYVTFHTILNLIQDFQEQSPILNSFGYGNLVDFSRTISGQTAQYPYLFCVPQTILYDENTTTYQITMLFADILDTTLDNEKDAVSDMSLESRRFLSYVKRGIQTFPEIYNNMDLQLPVSAIPYMERMGDHVAGVAVDVSLVVFEDINACNYYDLTPTPTPTITSSPTPTPTVTPTITPSSLPPISLNITSGATQNESCFSGLTGVIYTQDLGNCGGCLPFTCFPCLSTEQQLFQDVNLTIPVDDGYYTNDMNGSGAFGTWYVVDGYPQPGGFSGGC